ncbi:type VI secretion system baseplate subunit TssE [Thauera sinica]|uniref:Type VI secretion system baseplate subunit TssE n=1 Tax=Thauera sinica TaxID=2665146 RepID=A0ABW1ATL6_9RHOO|nr:type VI secretion system baseplate subunit TssE [Thauera sp. K11]ATE59939.1 type VI secretion system baseplate subunit TssE [Thauera sp. K11]
MRRPDDDSPRRPQAHLLPTLLDRLVDEEPAKQSEAPERYAVSQKRMREIVQRDLSWLLNATSLEDELDRGRHPAAASSVVNYGVPPFAGKFMTERNWSDIEKIIRGAIRDFEPRLIPESVQVVPLVEAGGDHHYNVLLFEIRGLIHMQPYPAEFMVQSALDLETSRLDFRL